MAVIEKLGNYYNCVKVFIVSQTNRLPVALLSTCVHKMTNYLRGRLIPLTLLPYVISIPTLSMGPSGPLYTTSYVTPRF